MVALLPAMVEQMESALQQLLASSRKLPAKLDEDAYVGASAGWICWNLVG